MTWLEFKTQVRVHLLNDASRRNVQDYIDLQIRAAVIDIQSHIPLYRVGHETVFGVDDLVERGEASEGMIPDQAQIHDIFHVKTGYGCVRQPLYQYPWANRHDLICGRMGTCQYAITIDPQAKTFLAYPKVSDGRQLNMHWDGLKLEFADGDTVPFDEKVAEAVGLWVTGMIELRINNDPQAHAMYMAKPNGLYYQRRKTLYLDANDRRRLRSNQPSPQAEAEPCHCEPTAEEADEEIEWVAFGDFGQDGTNEAAVAALAKSFDPDFLLLLGDCNYPSGRWETLEANLLKHYDGWIPGNAYPVWGNHDLETAQDGQYGKPLLNLFPNIAALNEGKLYYQFTRGPVEFFVFNSGDTDGSPKEPDGITAGSAQGLWLANALSESTADWKIVVMHRPPYTSEEIYTPGISSLRHNFTGAHLVLSGHGHVYERCLVANLTYLVCGLGGATKRGFGAVTTGSQLRYNAKYGALRFTASASRLQYAFYTVDGEIIDNVTLYK